MRARRLQVAPALRDLGARGVAFHEVIGPDPARCGEAVEAAERALEILAPCGSERVAVGVSPHAPYTVSDPLLRALAALASARGLKTAMHVAESREERAFVEEGEGPFAELLRSRGIAVQARGRSTVAWLEEAGFLDCRPLLVHCVTAGFDDFERARRHGATVAHCPWSNAVLGHGRADWAAMRRAGIAVGLGTDSVATGGRLDLFAEVRLAVLGLEGAPAPRDMLRLVTSDGAAALGLPAVGTLEPGAWGDLAAVGLAAPALADAARPRDGGGVGRDRVRRGVHGGRGPRGVRPRALARRRAGGGTGRVRPRGGARRGRVAPRARGRYVRTAQTVRSG